MRKPVLSLVLLVVGSLVFPEQAVSPKLETVGFWGDFFSLDKEITGWTWVSANVHYNYATYNFSDKGALAGPAGIGGRLSWVAWAEIFGFVFSSGYSFNSVELNGGSYHYHEFDPLIFQIDMFPFWRFGLRGGIALTLLWERWLPDQGGAAHTNCLGLGLSYPVDMNFWLNPNLLLTAGVKPLFIANGSSILLKHSFTVGLMFYLFI